MLKRMKASLAGQDPARLAGIGALLFATVFVLLAIIGAVRMFSPVPFWDMWGGTLGFYIALQDGNTSIWWAQHNEHRIILSRLLFWLDYELFGGMSVFLIIMNYVIVALAALLFWRIALARLADEPARRHVVFFVSCFVVAWLYQWMQYENLGWAFQSQFFLAQLLPLCALYLLHRSVTPGDPAGPPAASWWFFLACLAGLASAGTMANGILALPLMTLYALIMRLRAWQLLSLVLLTGVTLGLYFQDYHSPGHHGSISDALLQQPVQLALFVFLYLGTPFFYLFGQGVTGTTAALLATALMAILSLTLLYRGVRDPRANALQLALVFYIIYIVGSALGTGGGRLVFGVYQAVSFRYTTPALMAWACMLILALPWLWQRFQQYQRATTALIIVLLALMLKLQFDAARPQHGLVFNRDVAGLALELGVPHEAQILNIYEMSGGLLRTAEVASQHNLSIFGAYPWRDLSETLGRRLNPAELPGCIGNIDISAEIGPDENFITIDGWLLNNRARKVPTLITITDEAGNIGGYALAGQPRPDVADAIGSRARLAGFRGYVRRELSGAPVILRGDMAPCELVTELPELN